MRCISALGAVALGLVLLQSPPADACGGCFHESTPNPQNASVVTDHRMALSISPTQTVLWDQVRYQGDPLNFAWVLPVGQGATIELARDEWLGALDALSAPTIAAPPLPSRCGGFGGGGGGGFGCGAAVYDSASGGTAYDGGASFDGGNGVQVISQEVVGPYLAVTIRSTDGQAISQWLLDNGFEIPTDIKPVLDAYTNDGFDFIALKLAPNQGVQAMQPVRVVTPGADPTLPLRMVAAGIGSSVGLTLYVVAEGRYETASFPNLLIDRNQVRWNGPLARSNYTDLFSQAVAAGNGWVTESSVSASQLQSVYKQACMNAPQVAVPCDVSDAGADDAGAADDASVEASTDDASADDAATEAGDDAATTSTDGGDDASTDDASTNASEAGGSDASSCVQYVSACSFFTDWDTAAAGSNPYGLRITRLRTTLPASALTKDLTLAASADQSFLPNTMTAIGYTDPSYDPCPGAPVQQTKEGCGCDTAGQTDAVVSTSLGVVALLALARRRRRARLDA
jgi:MYXO-CTERM domain-containing protein